ncbi:MAG: hypothetical protein AAB373_04355 [Patescibacteria group bacterium]
MSNINNDDVEFYENGKSFGLRFKKPIDSQSLIDAIKLVEQAEKEPTLKGNLDELVKNSNL